MRQPTSRILASLALASGLHLTCSAADAGVVSGGARDAFARDSLLHTVQAAGSCWQVDGPNGPGYYPCGDVNGPIVGPVAPRRDGRDAGVHSPEGLQHGAPTGAPALAGVHGPGGGGAGINGGQPAGAHATGEAGAHLAAPASPVPASGAHIAAPPSGAPAVGGAATPHVAGPAAPRPTASAAVPHIGAPASPGLAGVHGVGGGGGVAAPSGVGRR
jgi:hypothetical protein